MGRICALVSTDFFKQHDVEVHQAPQLIEPLLKAQEAHATTLEALWLEALMTEFDAGFSGSSPAGGGR